MKPLMSACVALALVLTTSAFAKDTAGPAPNMMRNGVCNGMMPILGMMTMMGPSLYNQHADGCLASIKAELKITPAQEPQWQAFAAAIWENVGTMIDMFESMMMLDDPRTTLSERLRFEETTMAQHLASVKRISRALNDLQAVLNAEQKNAAKRLPFVQ